MQIDPKQLGAEIAELVRAACDSAQTPMLARIKALEDRAPVDGKDGRDGIDGKDVDPEFIKQLVAESVAAIPAPKDGANGRDGHDGVDGKDAPPITAEQLVEAIKAMPDVLEGIVKAWLAENPPAAGKDGADGRNGRDADPVSDEQIAKSVASHIALNPPPAGRDGRDGLAGLKGENGSDGKDGINGKDGADGLSLKDFDATLGDDGRTLTLKLADGEREVSRSFTLAVPLDRGVYREGNVYAKGDALSCGGSLWIAQQDAPTDKPGDGSKQWRLAVKHGRDGKDGNEGKRGERGMPGMSAEEAQRRRALGENV